MKNIIRIISGVAGIPLFVGSIGFASSSKEFSAGISYVFSDPINFLIALVSYPLIWIIFLAIFFLMVSNFGTSM